MIKQILAFLLTITASKASVGGDQFDFQEVAKKCQSYGMLEKLGEKPNPVLATVSIGIFNLVEKNRFYITGVAINPTTILTCAHGLYEVNDFENNYFVLVNNFVDQDIDPNDKNKAKNLVKAKKIEFYKKPPENCDRALKVIGGKLYYKHKGNLVCFEDQPKNFDDFMKKEMEYDIPDIALIFLKSPLPNNMPYPKIMDNIPLKGDYGISGGYGSQENSFYYKNKEETNYSESKRSLISSQVYSSNTSYLYSQYESDLKTGANGFKRKPNMKITEGLLCDGYSGGPLFVKNKEGDYVLAGISSATYSICEGFKQVPNILIPYLETEQYIYNVWTDIRKYEVVGWIEKTINTNKSK